MEALDTPSEAPPAAASHPLPPVASVPAVDPLAQTAPATAGAALASARIAIAPATPGSPLAQPSAARTSDVPPASGAFGYHTRFTICAGCTVALEVPITGGALTCSRCGTANVVLPRDDAADRAAAATSPMMSDAQRFEALRAQDGQPVMPPPALAAYLQGPIEGPRLQQCWQQWLHARAELRQMPSFPTQERLYFLGMFLYGATSVSREGPHQVRALIEATRDAVTEPRFRQQMHGMMARVAAREGDLTAAEQWLALCTPHSNDLHIDSAWRISRACVSTKQQDWMRVLAALGQRPEDVPIADNYDEMAAVLRANALEQLGQVGEAVTQLVRAGGGMAKVTAIIQANQALGPLCSQSVPQMEVAAARAAANTIRTRSSTGLGFLGVGIPLLVVGSIGFAFAGEQLFEGEVGGIVAGVGITLMTLLFLGGLFGGMAMAGARKARLQQTGARGMATLTAVRQTGTRINDQPLLELTMTVQLPGMEPYTAIHREVVPEIRLAQVQPGAGLQVAVDARDRRLMAILWG